MESDKKFTAYYVISNLNKNVFESDDIFKCLDYLKRIEQSDFRLIRRSDRKTLAFTSPPKFDINLDAKYK